jgi:hypothetical protein
MRLTDHAAGEVVLRADPQFNGVKVFSATMFADRDRLGDSITAWLESSPQVNVTQMVVTQSSDAAFHCIAITVFYWEPLPFTERSWTGHGAITDRP